MIRSMRLLNRKKLPCVNLIYIFRYIVFLVSCFPVFNSSAAEFYVGVSTNWALLKGEESSSGGDISELETDKKPTPVFAVKTLESYLEDSNFGFFIEFGLDSYKVNQSVTLGTEVEGLKGEYWYATPTLFYDFTKSRQQDLKFKAGLGAGLGYLTAKGVLHIEDPVFSDSAINGNDLNFSLGLFIELEYKRWVVQFKEYTPTAKINGIDLKLELPALLIGYRFEI